MKEFKLYHNRENDDYILSTRKKLIKKGYELYATKKVYLKVKNDYIGVRNLYSGEAHILNNAEFFDFVFNFINENFRRNRQLKFFQELAKTKRNMILEEIKEVYIKITTAAHNFDWEVTQIFKNK